MRFLILFALAIIVTFALIACKSADSPNRVASRSTPTAPAKPKVNSPRSAC